MAAWRETLKRFTGFDEVTVSDGGTTHPMSKTADTSELYEFIAAFGTRYKECTKLHRERKQEATLSLLCKPYWSLVCSYDTTDLKRICQGSHIVLTIIKIFRTASRKLTRLCTCALCPLLWAPPHERPPAGREPHYRVLPSKNVLLEASMT